LLLVEISFQCVPNSQGDYINWERNDPKKLPCSGGKNQASGKMAEPFLKIPGKKRQQKGKSSLPWPLGHVRLISFLGLVCAALLFFSTC
jgi:hypothetical protein